MEIFTKPSYLLPGLLLLFSPAFAASQATPSSNIVNQVQQKIGAYLTSLADLHCTESVTQAKLSPGGHVETEERAKYDYLIMMGGSNDDFSLNETRVPLSDKKSRPSPISMLVSNGIATALLVFHPYYRDSFKFETGADEVVDGKELTPVHFEPIPGRRTPAALALRGREYPLGIKGTAWVNGQTDEVVKIDASLDGDMSDIGLRSLKLHVEYKPAALGNKITSIDLPAVAVVDVTTPRQRWRNTHVFDAYKSFSTDAEPDPAVKIRAQNPTGGNNQSASNATPDPKEKP